MKLSLTLVLVLIVKNSLCIIDGFAANSFDIRSQTSVITRFPDGFTNICGGVLLAPSIVLTSAHCVFVNDEFAVTAKMAIGDINLNERVGTEQKYWSHAMAISKRFLNGVGVQCELADSLSQGSDANDDVAIVFLPRRARALCENALSVQVAKLSSTWSVKFKEAPEVLTNFQLENSVCYIAGWGKTEKENGTYSHSARQMMVKLTTKRIGKNRYLLAKGIAPSSRACMGDSGSPVYCFINGQRTFVGNVAHIGSFSRMSSVSPTEHVSFCRDFEYVFVSDWRETSGRVVEILEKYDQLEELQEGQTMCFGSGII